MKQSASKAHHGKAISKAKKDGVAIDSKFFKQLAKKKAAAKRVGK